MTAKENKVSKILLATQIFMGVGLGASAIANSYVTLIIFTFAAIIILAYAAGELE